MVKDRLLEFQNLAKKNTSKADKSNSSDGFSSRNDDYPNESTEFLNVDDWDDIESYLDQVKKARNSLDEMETCLEQMKRIHSNILISPGVHPKFTTELNINVDRFKQLSHGVTSIVKRMSEEAQRASKSKEANSRIKKNQAMTVSRRLHNVLQSFNAEQTHYRDKCKSKINSYLSISGLHMPEDEVDEAIESGQLFNTVGIMMAERDKKILFEDVKSRHEDILRLEDSIRELHEIFQDMSMLVESQGEMLNHIETNVGSATEYATKALYSVNYAKEAKKRNIKLKICLAICCLISIVVLFLFGGAAFCFYLPFVCR
uniref:t-SNARE coiled-coil homology domain-containing protein n=1 Tax=Ditylenchus dipsaci TaxID=166011 RepID=A0A915CW11_9BILA